MWSWLKAPFTKPIDVLVVGLSGAGKTSLIRTLCEISAGLATPPPFTKPNIFMPTSTTMLEIAGHSVNFIELSDEKSYWPKDTRIPDFSRISPVGIVIVVANGYYADHFKENLGFKSLDYFNDFDPYKRFDAFDNFIGTNISGDVLSARQKELGFLENDFDMCLNILDKRTSWSLEWVLTLVNKADLWWDRRSDVENFYRNIHQPVLLNVLKKYRGTQGAMLIRKYFSSRIQRFLGNVNPSSTFDDDDRWRLSDGLKETMAEALGNPKPG